MQKQSTTLLMLTITFILVPTWSQMTTMTITNNVLEPQVFKQQIPLKKVSKLPNENHVELIKSIDLEYTAYLFYHQGQLASKDIYDPSKYTGRTPPCRIYKTDLKLRQYRDLSYLLRPQSMIVVEHNISSGEKIYGNVLISTQNKVVNIYNLVLPHNDTQKFFFSPEYESYGLGIENAGNISVDTTANQRINLLNLNETAYILTSQNMYRFNQTNGGGQKLTVSGYLMSEPIIKVQEMEVDDDAQQGANKRFFILTDRNIIIYQLVDKDTVVMIKKIDGFQQDSYLLSATYGNQYFYATAFNTLYIVRATNLSNIEIVKAKLNGTCNHVQMFQTTLHISCQFEKLNYIIEAYALSTTVVVNRYYASEDIQGRAVTRRLGYSKMVIVTDEDLRIASYGINRQVLLENSVSPPQFVFNIKYGIDAVPLKKIITPLSYAFIVFTAQKMAYIQIKQTPPQLYCQFRQQTPGITHSILMQYNVSKCTYVKSQQDLYFGNIENVCQVSVPVQINTKQVILESKQTTFIQVTIALLIVGSVLLLIACAVKCNKIMRARFEKAEKVLDKARKGFKVDASVISSI